MLVERIGVLSASVANEHRVFLEPLNEPIARIRGMIG